MRATLTESICRLDSPCWSRHPVRPGVTAKVISKLKFVILLWKVSIGIVSVTCKTWKLTWIGREPHTRFDLVMVLVSTDQRTRTHTTVARRHLRSKRSECRVLCAMTYRYEFLFDMRSLYLFNKAITVHHRWQSADAHAVLVSHCRTKHNMSIERTERHLSYINLHIIIWEIALGTLFAIWSRSLDGDVVDAHLPFSHFESWRGWHRRLWTVAPMHCTHHSTHLLTNALF